MSKRIATTIFLFVIISQLALFAQFEKIGHYNSIEIIELMPEKKEVTKQLEELKNSYDNELLHMQNEYNKKYSDFISFQNSLAENIKIRRMHELTVLEERLRKFTNLAQKDIELHGIELIKPILKKIENAINAIGTRYDLLMIYDTADKSISFISPKTINLNEEIKRELGISN